MALSNKDFRKLKKKGFIVIRKDLENLRIKHKDRDFNWKTFENGFASKAAVERRINELLEADNIIED
ncbi:hypothetical protein [Epilithonimonas hominis]|uniref:hypothetical protein n=1 Tax=Epilithonimonas hominis TaxID=420404 RepID=UPI000EE84FDE|nr:hypothetical protein [Epilithonimonas hominis]HAP94524.1 hypothetical protein [Chryseobacterium sp.]